MATGRAALYVMVLFLCSFQVDDPPIPPEHEAFAGQFSPFYPEASVLSHFLHFFAACSVSLLP